MPNAEKLKQLLQSRPDYPDAPVPPPPPTPEEKAEAREGKFAAPKDHDNTQTTRSGVLDGDKPGVQRPSRPLNGVQAELARRRNK